MRQIAKVLVVAVLVSMVWTSSAHAAAAWFKCEVLLAGMPTPDELFIRLKNLGPSPAFTSKAFVGTSANAKEMFATALVAMSADLAVWVFVDADVAFPPIAGVFLTKR